MRNVIIWHWFIKNLVGTQRRNGVNATSLRRIDVVTTSCACWELGPPWPPQNSKPWSLQYSKPSYAYVLENEEEKGDRRAKEDMVPQKPVQSCNNTLLHMDGSVNLIFC